MTKFSNLAMSADVLTPNDIATDIQPDNQNPIAASSVYNALSHKAELSNVVTLDGGGAISGDIDIVDANLSINTFDNIYDVIDKKSLSDKLNDKQDKILSTSIVTSKIQASQFVYDGIWLSTGTGVNNPKRLYYPNIESDATIVTTDDIDKQLSDYLKLTGGSVSGDVNILSGNYVQTSTPLSVYNYSSNNGFIQAESTKYGDPAIGSKAYCILSVVVSEKAIIISGDFGYSNIASKQYPTQDSSKTFRDGLGNGSISLTVKHSLKTPSTTAPSLSDLIWSLALFNIGDTNFGSLTAIEDTTIGGIHGAKLLFDKLPDDVGNAVLGKSLNDYVNDFIDVNGDNALYVRGFVELGNQIPSQFVSQYAAGGSIKAIGKYTHAEGRDTIADGRYAHAEGTATIAGGVASHAEGQSTHAIGRSSHSEGEGTRAQAAMSHAEGYGAKAIGVGAHAEGGYWLSSGYSGNYAGGTASGKASHAEGHNSIASNEAAHAEGYSTTASGGYGSHSEGHSTSAVGPYSHAEGKGTLANGSGSHAEGLTSIANVYGSHVEGAYGIGNGNYVHVEGGGDYANKTFMLCSDLSTLYINALPNVLSTLSSYGDVKGYAKLNSLTTIYQLSGYSLNGNNLCIYLSSLAPVDLSGSSINVQLFKKYAAGTAAHAEGYNTRALTSYAHAEGNQSYATNYGAHAEGYQTSATGQYSHSEGFVTLAKETGAHAEGYHTEANNKQSHAAGHYAKANHDNAWCWNGVANTVYSSRDKGTFNINPENGSDGFYIGSSSLCSLIQNATSGGNAVQSTIVNALSDIGLTANTPSSDIDAGQVLQFMSKLTQLLA